MVRRAALGAIACSPLLSSRSSACPSQIDFSRVPHVSSVREFQPALIDRLGSLDGHLILVEGNPHRDLNADPVQRTERTPFGTHFEAMLPEVTGRSFYAQTWDAWHWTPFRGQTVAGGSFRGRAIGETPTPVFEAEMRKWASGTSSSGARRPRRA